MRKLVWLCIIGLAPFVAFAETDGLSIAATRTCQAIESWPKRVDCFDGANAPAFQACVENTHKTARKRCYDAKAQEIASSFPPEPEAQESPPKPIAEPSVPSSAWFSMNTKSAMTDQTTVILRASSSLPVQCSSYSNATQMTLILRCLENTTSLYISGDCHLASGFQGYGDVTARVDDGKATKWRMDDSTDNSALGFWTGARAIPAIKSLVGKERLRVRFTPFAMSPVEVVFPIQGLEEKLPALREACNW